MPVYSLHSAQITSGPKRAIPIRGWALLAFALVACLQTGCAARKPLVQPPEATAPTLETAADAVELLLRNYGAPVSLKASGKIRTKMSGKEVWRQASFVLMLERPDRLRMRAYRPLAPTLFELISDGERCWLYLPSESTAYLNQDCGPVYIKSNYVAIPVDAIAAALLVVADPDALSSMPVRIIAEENLIRLSLIEAEGGRREIWMEAGSGLATRQLLVDADGLAQADIIYKKHAFEGDLAVPVSIDVLLPRMAALISLRIEKFQTDAEIPADAYDFFPPKNVEVRRP